MDEENRAPDATEPEPTVEAAQVELAGEIIPLVERAVRDDGTIPIKIVAPGWGSSAYYPPEVLERDGPRVFHEGLHVYWDHPSRSEEKDRPERSLRDLAGVLTKDARWEPSGKAGPGLYTDVRVRGEYREAVEDLAPHIGMSLRGNGMAKPGEAEGRKGKVLQELLDAGSVDFVTMAGAGGQILELFEAAGRAPGPQVKLEEKPVTEEQARELREANESLTQQLAQATEEISRLREGLLLRQAQEIAEAVVSEMDMPAPTRRRVVAAQAALPVRAEDGALDEVAYRAQVTEAAEAELAYINEVRPPVRTGGITGMGASGPVDGKAELVEAFKRAGLSAELADIAANGR